MFDSLLINVVEAISFRKSRQLLPPTVNNCEILSYTSRQQLLTIIACQTQLLMCILSLPL